MYLFIGNKRVHRDKRILRREHRELVLPCLVSRAFDQENNVIWIWEKA